MAIYGRCDSIIVTLPFSPFDAGPPLGPAVLKARGEDAGFKVVTTDLNIRYLAMFQTGAKSNAQVVGDHAKDQVRVQAARMHFRTHLYLPKLEQHRVPCCTKPGLGLQHDFEEIESALQCMGDGYFWLDFFEQHLFGKYEQPGVLGLSIMGPAQVLPALLLARILQQRWPGTLVIAGGSHITLLQDEIGADSRYAGDSVDYFLPGHCEEVFVALLRQLRKGASPSIPGTIRGGQKNAITLKLTPQSKLPPKFERDELGLYDQGRLSYPIQFAKGCGYGRCTMCTYPAVELYEKYEQESIRALLIPLLNRYDLRQISIKDSLIPLPMLQAVGEIIQRNSPATTWSATTKLVKGMTYEVMQQLYEGGCRTLELGIETIHPDMQTTLDKKQPLLLIEQVLNATLNAGITVVFNLLYGLPGETEHQANRQLEWFLGWRKYAPRLVYGSHNLLEINRGAPMSRTPKEFGISLGSIGPWAFSYNWNAPAWRPAFERYLRRALSFQNSSAKAVKEIL